MAFAKSGEPFFYFWFRRDLRLHDNRGLAAALNSGAKVRPVFVLDETILSQLKNPEDRRVQFIYQQLVELKTELVDLGSDLWVEFGRPEVVWNRWLIQDGSLGIYCNEDYEPSARERDQKIAELCRSLGQKYEAFKDQVVFAKDEIQTDLGKPYTVYTPYKKKWLKQLSPDDLRSAESEKWVENFLPAKTPSKFLSFSEIGFKASSFDFPDVAVSTKRISSYARTRDFPALTEGTSHLGIHLRFGTVSARELAREGQKHSEVWLSELIWREFFMQVLWHHPRVERQSFRTEFESVAWRKNARELERWQMGETGYPMVDAGMRELNTTGFMHNRVRMVVASFLTKHLLHHWYEGERYFASRLLDYDLAANNGNWQWAAGTGCDAAPYFRIFNPTAQAARFDPQHEYIRKWVPEFNTARYTQPMVVHEEARARALAAFAEVKKKESGN